MKKTKQNKKPEKWSKKEVGKIIDREYAEEPRTRRFHFGSHAREDLMQWGAKMRKKK